MEPTSRRSRTACAATRNPDDARRAVVERWLGWLTLPLAAALFATQAHGATLTVQANVVGACSVSDNTLAFTSDYVSGQPEDVDGTVSVDIDCSSGLTVDIKLGPGNGVVGEDRGMTNGDQVLRYNLYKTDARAEVWGDGTYGTPQRVGPWDPTGSRAQVIYGRIFGGQTVSGGQFTDQIPLTVEIVPSS